MSLTSQLGTQYSRPGSVRLGSNTTVSGVASSTLTLSQTAKWGCHYLTAFDRVMSTVGLTADSQGELALLHLLLQCGANYADRNDVHANPFREVLRRFRAINANPHALRYVESIFNSFIAAYDRTPH